MTDQTITDVDTSRPARRVTSGGRLFHADAAWLNLAIAFLVFLVIAISFVMSFEAQTELAMKARISPAVAWGLPLIVDGTILVATFGTFILQPRSKGHGRYSGFVLVVFGLLSIISNGIHATGIHLTGPEVFGIGAVPAVALLTSVHLLVLMLSSPEMVESDADQQARLHDKQNSSVLVAVPSLPVPAPAVEKVETTIAPAAEVKPLDAAETATDRPVTPVRQIRPTAIAPTPEQSGFLQFEEVRERVEEQMAAGGTLPSRREIARWSGKTTKTAGRWLEKMGYAGTDDQEIDDVESDTPTAIDNEKTA